MNRRMVEKRKERIEEVAKWLDEADNTILQANPTKGNGLEHIENISATASYLYQYYDDAKKYPTWPFVLRFPERLVAAYLLPFAILIIDLAWNAIRTP